MVGPRRGIKKPKSPRRKLVPVREFPQLGEQIPELRDKGWIIWTAEPSLRDARKTTKVMLERNPDQKLLIVKRPGITGRPRFQVWVMQNG